MRLTTLLLASLLPLAAHAQTREAGPWWPHPEWGATDQAGASNRITPEKIVASLRLVQTGRVYEIGQVYERGMPMGGTRDFALRLVPATVLVVVVAPLVWLLLRSRTSLPRMVVAIAA